ncbi:MAG: hypothetical protein R3F29_04480 [Planctomycetota bacterium]
MQPLTLSITTALVATTAAAQSALQRSSQFEPRPAAAVAFEPVTGEAFLFGGGSVGTWRNDTWRFADGRWLPNPTSHQPPALPDPVACSWPGHGLLLVAGTETWRFDGVDWQRLVLAHQPAAVRTMTHDDGRDVVVALAPGATSNTSKVWEFDGADWTERTPTTTAGMPPTLAMMRLAYDAQHANCLLRINNLGTSATGYYAWDGVSWTQLSIGGGNGPFGWTMVRAPGQQVMFTGGIDNLTSQGTALYGGPPIPDAPARRRDAVAWYDSVRECTVVTACDGGNLGSWQWDGSTWTQPSFGQHVPVHTDDFAYDAWHGRLVAFSGAHYLRYDVHDQLWQLQDGEPQLLPTANGSPLPRLEHGAAFDSWRGRLVVFGGTRFEPWGGHYYPWTQDGGDVHEWDGQDWHALPSGSFPAGSDPRFRMAPAMCFDRARGRVVMFGGARFGGLSGFDPIWQNDTYEWDGATWTAMQPTTLPPATPAAMHFNVDRQQCVVIAGGQPWAWDGADWAQLPLPVQPSGNLLYDAARGTYVAASPLGTWELHGGVWTPIANVRLPNAATTGTIAFDPSLGRFAGSDDRGAFVYGDANAAWIRPFGDGCSGSAGAPRLIGEDPPRLDRTVHLRLVAAPIAAPWFAMFGSDTGLHSGLPLPLDLTALGMPGCALLTAIDVHQLRFAPDWPIHVPDQPLLLGQRFTAQAFVFDAAANALGATTSSALRLNVGGF